jgi:hypothetical protein
MSNTLPYKHIQEQTERQLLNIIVDKLCCISENTTANNEYKIAYYQEISDTTGTVTVPEGGTILLNQLAGGADALVSTIDGVPTGSLPQTAGGVMVDVTSFDVDGNWVLSGTPSAYPVALIYWLKISAADYPNLNINNIIEENIPLLVDNIYNTDGTLTGDRTLNLDTYDLTFIGGNVGIGTNAPSALLNVQNSSNGVLLARFKDNINAAAYLDIKTDPTLTDYTALYFGSDRKIMSKQGGPLFLSCNVNFVDGLSTKMAITPTEVQIGTITGARLAVKGNGSTSATTSFLVQNSSNTSLLTIRDNGNVGIGTTTPAAKIHADNTATTGVGAIIENSDVTNTDDIIQFHNSTGEVASITNDGGAGFGNSSIDASAKVEITSTTKGFLPPRMTGTQAEAISSPAEGLMVYSTDGSGVTITSKGWWGYDGSTWVKLN